MGDTIDRQCSFTKDGGERCKGAALRAAKDGQCMWHSADPAVREKAANARKRGGVTTAKVRARFLLDSEVPAAPETIEDLRVWAHFLVWAIATGRIDPRTADSVTRAIKVAIETSEGTELRERLTELEEMIAQVKRGGIVAS